MALGRLIAVNAPWLYWPAVNRRSLLGFVVVAALAATLAAGCGGGEPTRAEYEETVVTVRNQADAALARMQAATSEEDFITRLEQAGTLIDDAAGDLRDAGAPDELADENERLIRHLRELAAALKGTAGTARDIGFERLLKGARGLNFASWDGVNTVLADLRRQDIDVEPLRRH